jgi:hypothetical protein
MARQTSASGFDNDEIPTHPHQPSATFKFPKRSYGTKLRSCQPFWFEKWPFLHYDETNDAVYCHTCLSAHYKKRINGPTTDDSFVSCVHVQVQVCTFYGDDFDKEELRGQLVTLACHLVRGPY